MATLETAVPIRAQTRSERLVRLLSRGPLHIVLIGIALIWLVPTVGLALTSFRKPPAIASSGWWHSLTQWDWTLHNYGSVINATGMGHAWVNSVIITVPATILPLTLGALAAFGFAWVPFPFRDTLFLVIVALMIVPIQTSLVPLLKLFANHGHLNNHYYGIWLAHTAFGLPLAVFLLRNFFVTLPKDLIEAARIDGASNLAIFRRIVVPLSVPALASFAIFQFLWVWNDLLMALIFVSDPNKQPMTVRIPYLLSTYGQEYNLLAAAAFLLMILPLVVFFSLQRYFVQGLLAGSVKT
ncbi:MAG TPA: carbohydrate ABC transporter permease [Gaiellaceae bacterium]|jgi:alpha-glucoside transport system permease protein